MNALRLDFRPDSWPNEIQTLLLRACLESGPAAAAAWEAWSRRQDFERIDYASLRLVPLLHHNLARLGVEAPIFGRYRGVYRKVWCENQQLFHRAGEIIAELETAGIPTMALKGIALAHTAYPESALRPTTDIDLLIPRERAPDALRFLFDRGWAPLTGRAQAYLDSPLTYQHSVDLADARGPGLDLHWRVTHVECDPATNRGFWASAVAMKAPAFATLTLAPADHLLHAMEHGLWWNSGLSSLRWIADAMTILRRHEATLDWECFLERTRRTRLAVLAAHGLTYLRDRFHAAIPESVIAAVRREPIERWQYGEFRALSRPSRFALARQMFWFQFRRQRALAEKSGGARGLSAYLRSIQQLFLLDHPWQIPLHLARRVAHESQRRLLLYARMIRTTFSASAKTIRR